MKTFVLILYAVFFIGCVCLIVSTAIDDNTQGVTGWGCALMWSIFHFGHFLIDNPR